MGDGWWDCTDEYEYLLGPSVDSLINWKGKENTNKLNLLDTIIMLSSGLLSAMDLHGFAQLWWRIKGNISALSKRVENSFCFVMVNDFYFAYISQRAIDSFAMIILFGYLHIADYLYSDWFKCYLLLFDFAVVVLVFRFYNFCFFLMNDGWLRK